MKKELQRIYIKLLVPAVILVIIAEIGVRLGLIHLGPYPGTRAFEIFVFVLAVGLSLAFPVFYRVLYVNRVKELKMVPASELLRYEKNTLSMVLITTYLPTIAVLFKFSSLYYFGIILFALYGCYYYYPSWKRISFEKRIFRVKENITDVS